MSTRAYGRLTAALEIHLLTPVQATLDGHPVALGGTKQRALLAMLALDANRAVSVDRLIEGLWGEEPPPTAVKMLQGYISQLRKLLPGAIVTRGRGYELRIDHGAVDVERFTELVGRAAADGNGEASEALALWAGNPLGDVANEPFAAPELRRLEELRAVALELELDAELAAGRHLEIVPRLAALIAAHPLRERLYAQRMVALYRSGRQAEALEAFQDARRALREVGLEPGEELHSIQAAILRRDPALRPAEQFATVCPFKGLAAFEREDARFFCGRERLVGAMIARLAGARLLALVGPSGCGKSSAVRAGLLPALAGGALPGSEAWPQLLIRPLGGLGELPPHGPVVLAVDQFEETFTALRDPEPFLDAIVGLAEDRTRRALVVLVIRADFYGRCATHPGLARLVAANQVLVGPLQPDELRQAIEEPAARAGLIVEPALSARLVDALEGAPGALPLLSTALLELWRERDGEQLTLAAYERVGGVRGAVARVAEDAFASLSEHEQAIARRLLPRLVDEDERGILVRRRIALDELGDAEVRAIVDRLAERRLIAVDADAVELTHEALLREWPRLAGWLEEDAHGRRLHHHLAAAAREWIERGRDPGDLYRAARLAAALEWSPAHDDELTAIEREFLAAGRAHAEHEAVAARRDNRRLRALLGGAVALLALAIVAGVVALDQRGQARDVAVGADAERLGATALLDKQLDRSLLLARQGVALHDTVRTRGNLLGALLHSPAAIGMIRWDRAQVMNEAVSPDGSTLAVGDESGDVALFDTASRRHFATFRPAANKPGIYGLAYSPDGGELAVLYTSLAGDTAELPPGWRFLVALTDVSTRRVIRRIALPLERAGAGVRFSPDGETLEVTIYGEGGDGGALWRYDPRSGRPSGPPVPFDLQRRLTFNPFQAWPRSPVMTTRSGFVVGGVNAVSERDGDEVRTFPKAGARALRLQPTAYALSRNGRTVAIGGDDGSVHLLDLAGGELRTATGRHRAPVNEAIFTPDGRALVTASEDGEVILWDVRRATQEEALSGHTRSAFSPQIADDGATLYTADQGGTILIWDLAGNRRLGQSFGTGKPDDPSERYALSSDAALLAHGQSDGTVSVVDLRTLVARKHSIPVVDETGSEGRSGIEGMTFVPGTHMVVAGTLYGWAALVDADGGRVLGRLHAGPATYRMGRKRLADPVWTPGVSADGRLLVTATSNGTVTLWSLPERVALHTFRFPPAGGVSDAQISPDGRWLTVQALTAAVTQDALEIWDARRARRVTTLRPPDGVSFGRFSPDGRFLAVGDLTGSVTVYSTATWRPVTARLAAGNATGASFTPDGRTLATGTTGGGVQLWDIPSGQPIGIPLPGLADVIVSPLLTADATHVIAAYAAGRAIRWDIRPASLIRHACAVAGRSLTHTEWDAFLPGRPYAPAC